MSFSHFLGQTTPYYSTENLEVVSRFSCNSIPITAIDESGILTINTNRNTIGSGTFLITENIGEISLGNLRPNTNINIFIENNTETDYTITFPLTSTDTNPYNLYINVPSIITITAGSVNTMNVFLDTTNNVFLNVIFDPRVPIIGVITAIDDPTISNQMDILTNNNTLGSANYTMTQDINAFTFGSLVSNTNINIFIFNPYRPNPPHLPPLPPLSITFPYQSADDTPYNIVCNQPLGTPIELNEGKFSLMNIQYDQQDYLIYITFNLYG